MSTKRTNKTNREVVLEAIKKSINDTDINREELAEFILQKYNEEYRATIEKELNLKMESKLKIELQKRELKSKIRKVSDYIISGIFIAFVVGLAVNQWTKVIDRNFVNSNIPVIVLTFIIFAITFCIHIDAMKALAKIINENKNYEVD